MGEVTSISWTDHTFNPWEGCTPVSPGCNHCYAETRDKRHMNGKVSHWGKGAPRRVTSDSTWEKPLQWNRAAAKAGRRDKVFCGSLCDIMDDEAPEGQLERLLALIDETPHLIWQLLTKRPHRYLRRLPAAFRHQNVWLGASAENQQYYDVRWPILRAAAERYHTISFISYEPALGPLTLLGFSSFPDWVICGGETGPHFRPMEQQWAESLRDECQQLGVRFWMKQVNGRRPKEAAALIPVELLIRQFPKDRVNRN